MKQLDEKGMGKRLQAARQKAGLTQQALCQKANLSYSTLAKIERGAIKSPSIFTIQTIAAALGVGLDELVGTPTAATKQRQQSKSGINFVYFDINGCLVRFYHQAFTQIAIDSGQPADIVETAFWHYNDQICRGELTMQEFNEALRQRLAMSHFDWSSYYLEAVKPMPHMRELIEWALRYYGVGLLTNVMPGLVEALRQRQLIPDVAYDVVVDSSQVHLLKPEKKIYELANEWAGCSPENILFVDDSRINLMAAEKLGWHVMWFNDFHPEETVARIREALEPAR